jgi:hypothetical protein
LNTDHFQKSTAYLDGVLMSLEGDKVVIISYGAKQNRFYVTEQGEVNRCGEQGPVPGNESDFELYRMSFLEALINGGSLIVRQVGVGKLQLSADLGGGTVPLDFLCGAKVGPKGIRGLSAVQLKSLYRQDVDGAVEFRDFLSKERVKVALIKQVEAERSKEVPQTVSA